MELKTVCSRNKMWLITYIFSLHTVELSENCKNPVKPGSFVSYICSSNAEVISIHYTGN